MAYRRKSYTYWDGDAIFPIPFEYLEQDDILVFINDEQTTDFVIENTQVKLNNKPLEVPAIIKIVSATDIDKAAVEWENVSSLDEDNLILSDNQIRYAVQELYDNTEQFKVDTNQSFEDYKQETNQNIEHFREEIHTLLDDVSEAAELISSTIEAVDTAVLTTQEQALIATEQKELATEQANIAIAQTELVASTANKALEDIETLTTNSINTIESLSENSTEEISVLKNDSVAEINTLGNTIKSNATDWIDVINAIGKSYNMVTHRQITNCITEIPQDIKLELKDGTLTLKAGSKVYVPNGAGVFDEVVINSDLTYGGSSTNWSNTSWLVYCPNGTLFVNNGYYTSGSTYTGGTYGIWYDTTNNSVKFTTDGGSTWASGYSLPLAQITVKSGTGVTSIDQVFNGFGYIGSTVFVLPNVKGLIPNGRNEDGTLNNIECSFSKVVTQTNTVQYSGNIALQTDYFDLASGDYYDEETNYNRLSDGRIFSRCVAGKFVKGANGVITSFNPKLSFRSIDYNNKTEIVSWSIPNYTKGINQSIDTTYTADHDGYITFCNTSGYDDTRYTLTLIYNGVTNSWQFGHSSNAMDNGCAWINYPVPKGSQYKITKDGGGSAYQMIFFPMKGAN